MASDLTENIAVAVASDPQLRLTALAVVDRLSAPILQFARSSWGLHEGETSAAAEAEARSSGYGGGGGGYGGGGPSPLDTALSALALLAFALFFLNAILPLITGGGTGGTGGTGTGTGGGKRSLPVDDPLPLDLTQEALNLLTSWVTSSEQREPDWRS